MARAGTSPTRSGPEGSSRNEPRLGRCQPLTFSPLKEQGFRYAHDATGHRILIPAGDSLADLGWSSFFADQCTPEEQQDATPMRVISVHRSRVESLGANGPQTLFLRSIHAAGDIAVGDWVLAQSAAVLRVLERKSLVQRHAAGKGIGRQLIAANLDTVFIVTSCNADFNPARLERYLALVSSAGVSPVILLTKSDTSDDPARYLREAETLSNDLTVLPLDARAEDVADQLARWCGPGRTVALLGSSGVGKSTLANALTGGHLATQGIREDDAKGRHTTTARHLLAMTGGGWVIDTPGMRELRLTDAGDGIDAVFEDLTTLATQCKFRNCAHDGEPGCAIEAAQAAGQIDPERRRRWAKLLAEDSYSTETLAEARARQRGFSKKVRSAVSAKPAKRGPSGR